MASRNEVLEDQTANVMEDMIHVAVGKDMKEGNAILLWALQNSKGKRICILHVPVLGTEFPASSVQEKKVRHHREAERLKLLDLLDNYLLFCRQSGVQAQRLETEIYRVEEGVVQLISQHGIKKLVMGAAPGKSNKQEASAEAETGRPSRMTLRSLTMDQNRYSTETRQSNFQRSQSAIAGETSSPKTRLNVEARLDELEGLSKSRTGWGCWTRSSKRVVDVTLTPRMESSKDALQFGAPSPAMSYSRSPSADVASSLQLQSERLVYSIVMEVLKTFMSDFSNRCLRHGSLSAERDMIDATRRIQEELIQEKEQELENKRGELGKEKKRRNQLMEELRISKEQETSLKNEIAELKKERDELQMERDNALKDAEGLRRKQGESSSREATQFSEFLLAEIKEATQNFSESLKIGQGGYGNIYKGLVRQTEVAVKILECHSAHGTAQFQMEVRLLSHLRHPNLVKLIGSCAEVYALIYEYLPNGNLEDRLRCKENSPPLSWQTQTRIATELCSVLMYLHSIKPHSIVHGDLKPSNILLDANFVRKLSDFGICRLLFPDTSSSENKTMCHVTVPKGTMPYIDPEFQRTGVLTLKSDVYSFGIILLQLLTGRPPFLLQNDVKCALDDGNLNAILDPLAGDWPVLLSQKLARLGLRCCDWKRKNRPDLATDVWKVLTR